MLFTAEEIYRALHSLPPVDNVRADSFRFAVYRPDLLKRPTHSLAPSPEEVRTLTFEKMDRDGRVVWGLNIR